MDSGSPLLERNLASDFAKVANPSPSRDDFIIESSPIGRPLTEEEKVALDKENILPNTPFKRAASALPSPVIRDLLKTPPSPSQEILPVTKTLPFSHNLNSEEERRIFDNINARLKRDQLTPLSLPQSIFFPDILQTPPDPALPAKTPPRTSTNVLESDPLQTPPDPSAPTSTPPRVSTNELGSDLLQTPPDQQVAGPTQSVSQTVTLLNTSPPPLMNNEAKLANLLLQTPPSGAQSPGTLPPYVTPRTKEREERLKGERNSSLSKGNESLVETLSPTLVMPTSSESNLLKTPPAPPSPGQPLEPPPLSLAETEPPQTSQVFHSEGKQEERGAASSQPPGNVLLSSLGVQPESLLLEPAAFSEGPEEREGRLAGRSNPGSPRALPLNASQPVDSKLKGEESIKGVIDMQPINLLEEKLKIYRDTYAYPNQDLVELIEKIITSSKADPANEELPTIANEALTFLMGGRYSKDLSERLITLADNSKGTPHIKNEKLYYASLALAVLGVLLVASSVALMILHPSFTAAVNPSMVDSTNAYNPLVMLTTGLGYALFLACGSLPFVLGIGLTCLTLGSMGFFTARRNALSNTVMNLADRVEEKRLTQRWW